MITVFESRESAAQQLAKELRPLQLQNPFVLGVPRGGAVTAAVLALELGAELDLVLAHKLRAPFQSEYAIGAIGEDNEVHLDHRSVELAGADDSYIKRECKFQAHEIARRRQFFRAAKPKPSLQGRSVILTDDGIATGATMIAAIRVVKAQRPHELIVAVPVGSPEHLAEIRCQCDRLVCLAAPEGFQAVGQYYHDFSTVTDADVIELLKKPDRYLARIRAIRDAKTLLDF